jgi:RNA polymerase sigma-70 factor (ECF subfamily)
VSAYNERIIKIAQMFAGGEAEDIAQEVWLKIYRYRERLAEVENIDSWLYRVVKRRCLNCLRSRNAGKSVSYEESAGYIDGNFSDCGILEALMDRLDAAAIREHVEKLDETFRIPILLYYYKDIPLQEIAEILGVPYSTVKWRLYIGRQKLKKLIGGYIYE